MLSLVAPYKMVELNGKKTVNVRRYNKMVKWRKLYRASFIPAVRLVGGNKRESK